MFGPFMGVSFPGKESKFSNQNFLLTFAVVFGIICFKLNNCDRGAGIISTYAELAGDDGYEKE